MLFRDDRQLALNNLAVACKAAADAYNNAAAAIQDQDLAALFRAFEGKRRDAAERLDREIRKLGDLPRSPDPDFGTARRALTQIKATLSPDERSLLLYERQEAERKLLSLIEAAEKTALPAESADVLRSLRGEIQAGMERLAALSQR